MGHLASAPPREKVLFRNPFHIEDLMVFDHATLRRILCNEENDLSTEQLAHSLQGASPSLVHSIEQFLSPTQRSLFLHELQRPLSYGKRAEARRQVLDALFWELTYWKTPALYEELTAGEHLHPGIFQQLESVICGKQILDVGAGTGRASFECLHYNASHVYAVEPSPGLLRILKQKIEHQNAAEHLHPLHGTFASLPLADDSVDTTLSCSAFTPEQGGEAGLAEMRRVTKPGSKIVLIWPRVEDHEWLKQYGFHYVSLPLQHDMHIHFHSWRSALHCASRFYAHKQAVLHYIRSRHRREIPFSMLGINPPHDYCWLEV